MDRSWFSNPSFSRHGLLSDSTHELPRWRSPSPMAASVIPPPIVQSTYAGSPKATPKPEIMEKPSPYQDRQGELEADLQFLLDAQAEGLVDGLEAGLQDDTASTGSTTPTVHSVRSASARRKERPVRRKVGLRSARKGIYHSIVALSAVKNEELQVIDAEIQEKNSALHQIDEWEQKRRKLQDAAKTVDSNEETARVQRLREEADALQAEINNVELQLSDMKARHRKVTRQVAAEENSVQAKLASYTASLSMLEADVQKFLATKPPQTDLNSMSFDAGTSLRKLPAKRRTLEMARDQYSAERESMLNQRRSVKREKAALADGGAMWKYIVAQVTDFEKRLRAEMASLSTSSNSNITWEDPSDSASTNRLRSLLGYLDTALDSLQEKFKLAEERDWRLLIAAIGAELDALRRGKQILHDVLGVSTRRDEVVDPEGQPNGSSASDEGDEIRELDKSFETARRRRSSDSEDPDPELMFSRKDSDTG